MKTPFMEVHPDDVLLFQTISEAVWKVARKYHLPLKQVKGLPSPEYAWSPKGRCYADGTIELVMRGMVNGEWDTEARREEDIWKTAAHELAHLRHMNHGIAFQEFEEEMFQAISNLRVDHRQKTIDRLIKMQKSREGEAAIGNSAAAEAFAAAINRMLIEHELNPSDLDYARAADQDPVIEIKVNWKQHQREGDDPRLFKPGTHRIAWQETLARIVANAHLCTFLITAKSDDIWFVGTKSHATVAEYVYSMLVIRSFEMAKQAAAAYKRQAKKEGDPTRARGYREAWTVGFIKRIDERFQEARKAAVKEASSDIPGGESQALMRLDGALMKVRKYIDDRFKGGSHYLPSIKGPSGYHKDGTADGRAAADRMPIGRRGVDTSIRQPKGHLKE